MNPPRGRSPENEGLEKHVYWNNGTLVYKRRGYPQQQLGTDVDVANEAARQITALINGDTPMPDPLAKFKQRQARPTLPGGSPDICTVIDKWQAHWTEESRASKGTIENTGWRINRIKAALTGRDIHSITTADCAELLDTETRSEYPKVKSILVRMFAYAKEQGWYPSQWPNPAAETGTRRGKDKDRQRMTVEQYKAIDANAPAWIKRTMAIALYTLLRRSDLVRLRLDDTDPNYFLRDNVLHVIPQKSNTRNRKSGPSRLRWDLKEHPELAKLIQEARIESMRMRRCPFVICTQPERRTARARAIKQHEAQVLPSYLSKSFAKVRAQVIAETKLFEGYEPNQLPGIHEIRALGSHLLKKAKADPKKVQELMDHTDEKMTNHYQEGHEETWVDIALRGIVIGDKTA